MIWIAIFAALTALGVWMFSKSNRLKHEIARYEFEHRSSGGVVGFASYEDSVAFQKKKRAYAELRNGGLLAIAFGGVPLLLLIANKALGG
jgi:hypothetical protein